MFEDPQDSITDKPTSSINKLPSNCNKIIEPLNNGMISLHKIILHLAQKSKDSLSENSSYK
jgi:hypothetical protein